MSTWYYTDEKGERVSVTGGQLKWLAKNGKITPETIVETEDGKTAPARKVKGLTFITPESTPSETAPVEPAQPAESEIYGVAASSTKPSPFTASMPETVGTPVAAPSEAANPFTASMPTVTKLADNPFTAPMTPVNQEMPQSVPIHAVEKNKSSFMVTLIGIVAVLVVGFVGLAIIGSMLDEDEEAYPVEVAQEQEKVPPQQGTKPAVTMTAAGLLTRYNSNPLLFDADRKGERFIVSGVIDEIGRDSRTRQPYIQFYPRGDRGNATWIRCFFRQEDESSVLSLSKGTSIHIEGTFGGTGLGSTHSMTIGLTDCFVRGGAVLFTAAEQAQFTAAERAEIDSFCAEFGSDITGEDKNGNTLLHLAVMGGNMVVTKFLLSRGANVNVKNSSGGETPLGYAVSFGRVEFVKLLLSKGANVNAKNNVGGTILGYAVSSGRVEIAQLLISGGADVNTKNMLGGTLLHDAATYGKVEVAQILISKGLNVNAKSNSGKTPLHEAAGNKGNVEIVKLLISKGANVNAKDQNNYFFGKTPLDIAEQAGSSGNPAVAKYLKSVGAKKGQDIK